MDHVSFIIPACNNAETIPETLESVFAQTYPHWEAIVVDDGSADDTPSVVQQYMSSHPGIRLLTQANSGVSVARNCGIAQATGKWLVFLDADDRIAPGFLERMLAIKAEHEDVAVVHCGWCFINASGETFGDSFAPADQDMFPHFARTCAFPIHAAIVRKEIVNEVGCFDESLRYCADWDLWQRIARTGRPFHRLREVMAYYRIVPGSLSTHLDISLAAAVKTIHRGHHADDRVASPDSRYINGMDRLSKSLAMYACACWYAGMYLARGKALQEIWNIVDENSTASLAHDDVASLIAEPARRHSAVFAASPADFWLSNNNQVCVFLEELEKRTGTAGLTNETTHRIAKMVTESCSLPFTGLIGHTLIKIVDVSKPIADFQVRLPATSCIVIVSVGERKIGDVEPDVKEGKVLAGDLTNTIAEKYAWPLVLEYFRVNTRNVAKGVHSMSEEEAWTEFLREVWGKKDWPSHAFYDADYRTAEEKTIQVTLNHSQQNITVEVSERLKTIRADHPVVIRYSTGFQPAGEIEVAPVAGRITPQAQRASITTSSAFQLCICVVKEALIGSSFSGNETLRHRLREKRSTLDRFLSYWKSN